MLWKTHREALASCAAACVLMSAFARPAEAQKSIPTPESVFGFPVGADHRLFGYDQSIAYFKRLAAASNRVKLIDVGTTAYGHSWTAVIISSPDNLKNLDHYRDINMRLAHPEGLSDDQARNLARTGKMFVDISGGLHASEIAGSQMTPQLAYELLSRADEPKSKEILDNVIFFLWPSINPDGQDIVVDHCNAVDAAQGIFFGPDSAKRAAGPRPPAPPPSELYEKYVGHDNNRDSYMLNVVESRVIQRIWRDWEPDIIYVHHQASPEPTRIWVPPFADPIGVRAPPIPSSEINVIGTTIASTLDANGMPGTVHQLATFDAWYPGYIDYMGVYQNIPSWWTETQGGNCAVPHAANQEDPARYAPYRDLRPGPLYVAPWAGGPWGLRDAVNYMVTASMATLTYAAKYREDMLYNRYQSGRDVIRKYRTSAPYAYVVPQAQYDPMAPVELLRRLAFMGIRIDQLDHPMAYDGTTYPAGTWVIPMDQEFAELVRELLEVQTYPPLGDERPYDAAGWTLPYQMNVQTIEGKTPLTPEFRAALKPIVGKAVDWHTAPDAPFTTNAEAAGILPLPAQITGTGDRVALDPAQNNAFRLLNRALAKGGAVRFQPATAGRGARYVVSGVAMDSLDRWSSELALRAERTTDATGAAVPARIALYKASPGNMDEGWTEWLFDTHGFHYTLLNPADARAGNLNARFDAIIFGAQGLGGGRGGGGAGCGGGGGGGRGGGAGGAGGAGGGGAGGRGGAGRGGAAPDSSGAQTTKAIDDFVRGGGTAVFWNGGTSGAICTFQLPVRNVVAGLAERDYFTGGSLMAVTVDRAHPVMAGMPDSADVFVDHSPVFTTLDGFQGSVLAKYQETGTPVRSGFLIGEKYMQGFVAALDAKHDLGHVILIAFQPEWRGQSTNSFRIVFNAALLSRETGDQTKPTPGFWSPPALPAPPPRDSTPPGRGGRGGGARTPVVKRRP